MKKLSKKNRIVLSILGTLGGILLIIFGVISLKYGLCWHTNEIAQFRTSITVFMVLPITGSLIFRAAARGRVLLQPSLRSMIPEMLPWKIHAT